LLEEELEAVGIRLNKQKPKIYFKPRKTGGLAITSMVPLTKIDEKLVHSILAEYS
jgi:ribosome-interacting GTPase 1